MKFRILVAGLMLGMAAMAAETGAELFQKALTAERAAGNLEEAIKLYQRIAKEFASDRALAAKALVQEARCYEKLGKDNAVKIYEEVAREYKDQPEPFATASARLAALKVGERPATAGMTQRKIELPLASTLVYKGQKAAQGKVLGFAILPTDGHRVVYKDATTGALMISDLAGQDKRVILKPKAGEQIGGIFPSRDFSTVFLGLRARDGVKAAVIKTDGTGYRDFGPDFFPACGPPDWSWDDRYFFHCHKEPDGASQVLRVSVTDGEIRNVGSTQGPLNRPSPDGRFIASSTSNNQSIGKVWIMPVQGGEPEPVSENAHLVDWTRDGRYLIITSPRSGSEALYLLPIKDGKSVGDPVFVHYGPCFYGSTVSNGSLVCHSTYIGDGAEDWAGSLWILENFEPKQQAAR
jgi:hypothetical protein